MCFDLGWTFVRAQIPRKGSDKLKFMLYTLFACGVPAILLTVVVATDLGDRSLWGVKPDVGKS